MKIVFKLNLKMVFIFVYDYLLIYLLIYDVEVVETEGFKLKKDSN